ncbi:MAG: hypothetical protein FD174_2610 [Geobacteraceae bacterium]|nr:MAG: hypothetical protein FD174_2610 [Geobacteraceae bacterium]
MMEAKSVTCAKAAERHPGVEERNLARMCLRGEWLVKKYGKREKVPPKEAAKALFAKKVGRCWQIPVDELDRVFLS